jgi:hypothetical protein
MTGTTGKCFRKHPDRLAHDPETHGSNHSAGNLMQLVLAWQTKSPSRQQTALAQFFSPTVIADVSIKRRIQPMNPPSASIDRVSSALKQKKKEFFPSPRHFVKAKNRNESSFRF